MYIVSPVQREKKKRKDLRTAILDKAEGQVQSSFCPVWQSEEISLLVMI